MISRLMITDVIPPDLWVKISRKTLIWLSGSSDRLKKGDYSRSVGPGWVLAQGDDIVPIPGTKRRKYLEENIAAGSVVITPEELAEIAAVFPRGLASGERYPAYMMAFLNR